MPIQKLAQRCPGDVVVIHDKDSGHFAASVAVVAAKRLYRYSGSVLRIEHELILRGALAEVS